MDYHLDWLAAAVHAFKLNAFSHKVSLWPEENKGLLTHTVLDIDLVIADAKRVILIEAKAFGSWNPEQLTKKIAWLRGLLDGDNNVIYDLEHHYSIQVFFVLTSRKPPARGDRHRLAILGAAGRRPSVDRDEDLAPWLCEEDGALRRVREEVPRNTLEDQA